MKLLSVIGICSFLFATSLTHTVIGQTYIGQEKIETKTLPLYRVLTVVQDAMQKMRGDSPVNDVLAGADDTVKQSLMLLTSCVDAINNNVLYEFGDIRDRFMAMAMCVGDFGAMPEPYILREFRRIIREFDTYVTTFVASRAAFLSPQAKNTFESMKRLNQLLLNNVLNDENFSWGFLDYLDDYVISRPLEFVQEHPVLVSSIVCIIIASVLYCYWGKTPEDGKDEVKNPEIKKETHCEPKPQSKKSEDSEKKCNFRKIHDELKPVFHDIAEMVANDLSKKNILFMTKNEFDNLLQNNLLQNKKSPALSLDAQEKLYDTVSSQKFYFSGDRVSLEKLNKVFTDTLENLKKSKEPYFL